MSNPGQSPNVYWDPDNKELGLKIIDKAIRDNEKAIKADEIRDTKQQKTLERESLSEGLPGEGVSEEAGRPGGGVQGEDNDTPASEPSEVHPVE